MQTQDHSTANRARKAREEALRLSRLAHEQEASAYAAAEKADRLTIRAADTRARARGAAALAEELERLVPPTPTAADADEMEAPTGTNA